MRPRAVRCFFLSASIFCLYARISSCTFFASASSSFTSGRSLPSFSSSASRALHLFTAFSAFRWCASMVLYSLISLSRFSSHILVLWLRCFSYAALSFFALFSRLLNLAWTCPLLASASSILTLSGRSPRSASFFAFLSFSRSSFALLASSLFWSNVSHARFFSRRSSFSSRVARCSISSFSRSIRSCSFLSFSSSSFSEFTSVPLVDSSFSISMSFSCVKCKFMLSDFSVSTSRLCLSKPLKFPTLSCGRNVHRLSIWMWYEPLTSSTTDFLLTFFPFTKYVDAPPPLPRSDPRSRSITRLKVWTTPPGWGASSISIMAWSFSCLMNWRASSARPR
mmetsp:Transcript_22640/g.53458  ORF Transcript_22640/g.53458 Transcript_22640/m.53458 type:complete len:337 (-) Transcript_22640:249-1259(-)